MYLDLVVFDGENVWGQRVPGGDPRVVQDLGCSIALHGVHMKHAQDQVLS